jgi:hypothetical protein
MRTNKRFVAILVAVTTALGFSTPAAPGSAQALRAGPKAPAGIWAQYSELLGSDTLWSSAEGSDFGWSVAVSGSTAVIGAPWYSSAPGYHNEGNEGPYGQATGRAYVFTRGPKGWQQTAELVASGIAPGDEFGASVAISGRTIVVGAPGHGQKGQVKCGWGRGCADGWAPVATGRAYVFQEGTTGWDEAGLLEAPRGLAGPRPSSMVPYPTWPAADYTQGDLGASVALSGRTAVVGGYGQAYVFTEGRSGWRYTTELVKVPFQTLTCCEAVALSGSTAVVSNEGYGVDPNGAPLATSDAYYALYQKGLVHGIAYVLSNGPTGWHQTGELIGPKLNPGEYLGSGPYYGASVATSGSTAAVGAPQFAQVSGANLKLIGKPGRAYVFSRTAAGWRQEAQLDNPSPNFGWSVAVSGGLAVVGAPGPEPSQTTFTTEGGGTYQILHAGAPDTGVAYVFTGGAGSWHLVAKLLSTGKLKGDNLGNSVATSGGTVLVGAQCSSRAYVFGG